MEDIPYPTYLLDNDAKKQIEYELMHGLFNIYNHLMKTEYMVTTPSFSHIVRTFVDFVMIWGQYPHEVLEHFVFALDIWAKQISIISFGNYIRCIKYYSFHLCNNTPTNSLIQDASNHILEYTKRKDFDLSFNEFLKNNIVSHPYFKPIPPSPDSDIEILNNIEADEMHFADLAIEL